MVRTLSGITDAARSRRDGALPLLTADGFTRVFRCLQFLLEAPGGAERRRTVLFRAGYL